MSIIVDTSVLSLALRRENRPSDGQLMKLESLLNQGQSLMLLGVILQEVLQGIRNPSDFEKVKSDLEAFPVLDMEREDYIAAAELWNLCKRSGVQAGTTDCQIAAVCIRHDCPLLTSDRDFQYIAKLSPLRLL